MHKPELKQLLMLVVTILVLMAMMMVASRLTQNEIWQSDEYEIYKLMRVM